MCDAYIAECHFYHYKRLYNHFVLETGVHGINFMERLCGLSRDTSTVSNFRDAAKTIRVAEAIEKEQRV